MTQATIQIKQERTITFTRNAADPLVALHLELEHRAALDSIAAAYELIAKIQAVRVQIQETVRSGRN